MALGKLPVPRRPIIWMIVGQWPPVLAVGAGGGCLDIFTLIYWGGRMVRWCWVNFHGRGVLLICIRVGQGPTVLAVGAGGGCLDIFSLVYYFSFHLPLSGRRSDIN